MFLCSIFNVEMRFVLRIHLSREKNVKLSNSNVNTEENFKHTINTFM